jgi:hypothetical protein
MPKTKLILSLSILLLFTLACNFVAPTQTPIVLPPTVIPELTVIVEPSSSSPQNKIPLSDAEVERIPVELALTALQSGAAVLVDVRSAQQYQASHIAGAISIPLDEINANPTGLNLDKDQWIITYCT